MTALPPPQDQFDILYELLCKQLLSSMPNRKLIRLYFADMLPVYLADRTVLREEQAHFLNMVIGDIHPSAVDGDAELFGKLQQAFLTEQRPINTYATIGIQ